MAISARVKTLAELSAAEARGLRGILFDLDDTLLTRGTLTAHAYQALWNLHASGLLLAAVTGRPSGWGAVIARQWPLRGCITENGAIFVVREGHGVVCRDSAGSSRRKRRIDLARLRRTVARAVPEARLADDCAARLSDVAWDIAEQRKLSEQSVQRIVREIESAGARHSRSSVHLHATFDADDKASGAVRFCTTELGGGDATAVLARFAFIGDSQNDAPCFSAFQTTFAVSNIRSSLPLLTVPPRFVADRPMGEGFAQIAAQIVAKR